MRYLLLHITVILLFCTIFPVHTANSASPDVDSEDVISEEKKDAAVEGMKKEVFGDEEPNLEADPELQEDSAELDENVEYEGEKERREKESETVYKYNKKIPKSTDEQIPRLWIVPKR